MTFGWPTRYLQLDMESVGGAANWDRAVYEANTVYKGRMVSFFLKYVLCYISKVSFPKLLFICALAVNDTYL